MNVKTSKSKKFITDLNFSEKKKHRSQKKQNKASQKWKEFMEFMCARTRVMPPRSDAMVDSLHHEMSLFRLGLGL